MAGIKTLSIIIAANIKGLESSMKKADKTLAGFASRSARLGSMLSFGITAPLTALGKTAFTTFTKFEDSIVRVGAVTGATAKDMKMLEAEAKRLGATTRFTAQQFADLQLILGRKGFDPSAIKNMTGAIADLALATGEDLTLAADTVASSINAFQLESKDAEDVANTLAAAAANSSIQLNTFATAFGHAGASANAVGVDIHELSAMMGVLMDNGIKASKAGTGLRKIFGRLNEEGIPFHATLKNLASGQMTLNDATDLVGVTAANQLLILADQKDKVEDLTLSYKSNKNALKDMTDLMGETTETKVAIMNSALASMNLEIGAMLAEALLPLIQEITKLASSFSELDPETKKTILNIAGIAAVVGPILMTLGLFAASLNSIFIAFGTLGGGIIKGGKAIVKYGTIVVRTGSKIAKATGIIKLLSGAFKLLTRAMMANPWVALATVVVAGGIALYDYFLGTKKVTEGTEDMTQANNDFMLSTWETEKALKAQEQAMLDAEAAQKKKDQNELRQRKIDRTDIDIDDTGQLMSIETVDDNIESIDERMAQQRARNKEAQTRHNEEMLAEEQRFTNQKLAFAEQISLGFADSFSQIVVSGENLLQGLTKIFVDIAKQIAAMIVKALVLASIFQFIPGFGGGALFGGAKNLTGILGSLMGGAFADGGNPPLGKVSLVGEKGPELFVPNSSGTIIPNNALGGMGGTPDVRISGDDLLIVFDKAQRRRDRR